MHYIIFIFFLTIMTFMARQNRQSNNNDNTNRNFGRGINGQPDQAQLQKKLTQQQLYKQQLQRQIQEKQARKKQEQQKIRRQDEKFMKEIQQIDKKQKEKKGAQKQKQQRILEDLNQSPKQKKQHSESKVSRIVPNGNMNFSIKDQIGNFPQIPRLGLMTESEPNQNYLYTNQRKRPYIYEQNDQVNSYYQQRIRRHKQQMNQKLDQLFHHIHSTKDNIKAQEQIDKIKRRLRSKQTPSPHQFQGQSQVQLQFQNKFYNVPKPNREPYKSMNQQKSRVLDYQSSSKFSPYKNLQSRTKTKTHYEELYNLPDREQYQKRDSQKWGIKPGKDNFLANREAIDYQAEKTLGQIDRYLEQLKKQA